MGTKKQKVTCNVDLATLVPTEKMRGSDEEETLQWKELLEESLGYLGSMKWCKAVRRSYLGIAVGNVLGVFLCQILPARPGIDECVWVIVGDLPPAYITTDFAPNPACAIKGYIRAMRRWVEAAKAGHSVEKLIPVNTPSTKENAMELESRLDFLRDRVLSYYQDELDECGDR